MKRRILAVLMVLCMMFIFAACGSGDTTETNGETSEVNEVNEQEKADEKTLSEIPGSTDKALLKPFLATWKYEEKDMFVVFNADFTWSMYDSNKENKTLGKFTVDEYKAYLFDSNKEFVMSVESLSMNQLVDDDGLNLFKYVVG